MNLFNVRGTRVPVFTSAVFLGVTTVALAMGGGGSLWLSSGQDRSNNRHQASAAKIDTSNVGNLAVQWQFDSAGPVSATPAVDGTTVYFPDFGGNLYALDRATGAVVWQKSLA
jgi:polyvinyl alcohol dehydrogenase (cytochrome)